MSPLLRAELLKLRTTRTFAVFVGAAVALSLLVVVLTSTLADDLTDDDIKSLFFADFTSLFILLLGVMGSAGEWRHHTITSSVLAAPRRVQFLAAKTIAYAIAGAALSLVVTVTIMVVGSITLSASGYSPPGVADLADILWRNLLVAALLGALGVGLGGIVRSQVAAIVGILVLAFVIEPTVFALASDVGRYGPTTLAPNGILGSGFDDDEDLLAPALAALVMLAWVGGAFAVAAALLRRRDLV